MVEIHTSDQDPTNGRKMTKVRTEDGESINSLRALPVWSPDSESPHPFVAAQRAVQARGTFDRSAVASEAYWVGSEDTVKFFPIILLNCLRSQENYIKKFMYKDETARVRVKNWMDRAANKYHFPCSGRIDVESYEGHSGYNFVDSFRSTSWTPSMLGTYVIPSTLMETRHWVSFCLSILAYACVVTGNPIEGDTPAFRPIFGVGRQHLQEAEEEQIDLLKEAIYFLYEKRGIRLFPPRPGGPNRLDQDEFVIPSFASGSKSGWSTRHFVIALMEHNWVLSPEERSFSNTMRLFQDRVKTQALEGGGDSKQLGASGTETHGIRKQLRKAVSAKGKRGERVDVSGLASSGPSSHDDSNPTPAAGVPHSWSPSGATPSETWAPTNSSPRGTWRPSTSSWSTSQTWEEGSTWSGREWTNWNATKGQSKGSKGSRGSGSNQWSKDDQRTNRGW